MGISMVSLNRTVMSIICSPSHYINYKGNVTHHRPINSINDSINYDCDTCGQKKGNRCKSVTKGWTTYPHANRIKKWINDAKN